MIKMTKALANRAQVGTFCFSSTFPMYFDPTSALSRANDQVRRADTSTQPFRANKAIIKMNITKAVAAAAEWVA